MPHCQRRVVIEGYADPREALRDESSFGEHIGYNVAQAVSGVSGHRPSRIARTASILPSSSAFDGPRRSQSSPASESAPWVARSSEPRKKKVFGFPSQAR